MPLDEGKVNEIQTIAFDADISKFDILSLADYIDSVDRKEGVKKGVASRELHNKQLQQLSKIVVAFCQFVANRIASDGILDTDTLDSLESKFLEAFNTFLTTNLTARKVIVTTPLVGGGNLNSNVNISIQQASTTQIGATKLATSEDVITGTSNTLAVTPASLQSYVPGWNAIADKPATFPPSTHNQGWDTITGKPSTFTPSAHNQGWDTITGKPATYAPSAHTHDDRYYTETEINTKLAGYLPSNGKAVSAGTADSATNSDKVDGSHAWEMQTLAASGTSHGANSWVLKCQHNVDGDGAFKFYVGDKSLKTKVDLAINVPATGVTSGTLPSGVNIPWGQVTGKPAIPTGGVDSSGTTWIRFTDGTQICWGSGNGNNVGAVTCYFSKAFNSAPTVICTCPRGSISTGYVSVVATVETITSTYFSGTLWVTTQYAVNQSVKYIAIGTWK